MTAAADARNSLLAKKNEERQAFPPMIEPVTWHSEATPEPGPVQIQAPVPVQPPPVVTQPLEPAQASTQTSSKLRPKHAAHPARPKFDPSRPLHTQPLLAPPPPDEILPTAAALKDLMFPPSFTT
ncbi:unnamed protein product [Rhizoctonia solani]|uniref:Uncharacterized protein n=1 Tax=Rhizoctonia solani TaxID=456999 RepID=A0A8H3E7I8_9AGAM|nr:unnamed protein product [Rhizoctonia solani]